MGNTWTNIHVFEKILPIFPSGWRQNVTAAEGFAALASAGMVGVNIGVPVPREPFGFGGWNDSRFGVGNITGEESIEFLTQSRKITSRWPDG